MGTGASAIPPLAKAPTGGGDGGDSELVQLPVSEKFTPPTKELGEAEENCEEDEAGCGDYEDDPAWMFPESELKSFCQGKTDFETAQQRVISWAQNQLADDPEADLLGTPMSTLSCFKACYYKKGLELLMKTIPVADGEAAFKVAFDRGTQELVREVMGLIPPAEIEVIKDANWLLTCAPPSFFQFDERESWKLKFMEEELLPRGRAAAIEELKKKDDEGRCCALQSQFDNLSIPGLFYVLSLGADITGLLHKEEAEKIASLYKECKAKVDQWPTHVKLCKAIGRGKPEEVKEMLKTADPNMDHVDGDSATVSPLVLAIRKNFERRWYDNFFRFNLPHAWQVMESKSNLEVIKVLLETPELDPNRGAYSYGWHGSHVRCTPLGMALIEDLDTGSCYHTAESDRMLVAPRRDILELLLKHPEIDLENAYMQAYEEGGNERCGALALLDRDYKTGKDHFAAMMLMQAGALMTRDWKANLDSMDETAKDLQEEIKKAIEEEAGENAPADQEDVEEDAEADYTSFEKLPNGDLLVEGLTFQHFNKARFRTPRRSEILQSRLKDLEEVKSWYAIVSKGSNVFMHPKSFPASFCRVAAAFKKGTILTKPVIGSILDFVDFFEFNRERKPGLPFWERSIDIFGRPQSNVFFQMQKLLSSFENELAERDPSSLPTTPFQAEVKEPKANNTCWAVEPKAAGGEGGDGEDEVPEAECDEY
ncbi:unnamed protein product [Durusdinium trenchii]|uniref:Uncharacterized protein n=1 Tax=Durusdinium trenchii TaxID=1381693 RepID=A0ABP0HWI2_9DINO